MLWRKIRNVFNANASRINLWIGLSMKKIQKLISFVYTYSQRDTLILIWKFELYWDHIDLRSDPKYQICWKTIRFNNISLTISFDYMRFPILFLVVTIFRLNKTWQIENISHLVKTIFIMYLSPLTNAWISSDGMRWKTFSNA